MIWDVARMAWLDELETPLPQESTKYKGEACDVKVFQKREEDIKTLTIPKVVAFSPCGTMLAGGVSGAIWMWDAATYETRMVICQPRGCQEVEVLTFSPCGRYLVSGVSWQGTDKVSIRLWEVSTGKNIHTFWGHPTDIQDLAFSPDGSLLASASYDGTILLWDMKAVIDT